MRTLPSGARLCVLAMWAVWAMQWAAAAAPVAAQPAVYRCGQTYQQVPCPAEPAQPLDLADRRTPAQQQEARAAAMAERRQASELAAERKARDKAVTPQAAPMGIAAPRPDEAASAVEGSPSKRRKKKPRKDDDQTRYWPAPAAKGQ